MKNCIGCADDCGLCPKPVTDHEFMATGLPPYDHKSVVRARLVSMLADSSMKWLSENEINTRFCHHGRLLGWSCVRCTALKAALREGL